MQVSALVPPLPRSAWQVLAGDALSAIGTGLTLPFFIVYLHNVRGIGFAEAGLALSTIALAGLVGNPVGGFLSDRFGARRTLVGGLVLAAIGAASIAFVTTASQAFGAAALFGLGQAIVWPSRDALLARLTSAEQRSSVYAVRHATLNLGFGIGAVGAALIASFSSVRSFQALYLLDALSFAAFAVLAVRVPLAERGLSRTEITEVKAQGYRAVLRDTVFMRLWLLTALLVLAGYAQFHAAFPAFATGSGGIGSGALSIVFAVNFFVVAAVQVVMLRFLAGRRRTDAVIAVCVLWAAAWAITLVGGELGGGTPAMAVFAAALGVFALGETLLSPTVPAMANDLAPDRLRGRYNGMYTGAWTIGFMVGPAVAGLFLGAGHGRALFFCLIAACAVGVAAAVSLARHVPESANRVGAA